MTTIDKNQLLADLKQFSGSEDFYFNPLFRKLKYTEGVQYLAQKAESYWLIDFIFSNQNHPILKTNEFQNWNIKVENNKAKIIVEDGNHNKLKSFKIDFTDFPLEEFTVWFVYDTLMLPSEY